MALQRQFVGVESGKKLAVWCSNDTKKPPIVLVHGMPMNHRMWDLQIPYLEKNYYVVAPDLRGCGESDQTPDGPPPHIPLWVLKLLWGGSKTYNFKQWAKDLNSIINSDTLDPQDRSVHLVGLSMGGAVVMQYMCDYAPAPKIKDLILIDPAGPSFGKSMQALFSPQDLGTYLRLQLLCAGFLGFIALIRKGQLTVDVLLSLMFPQIACKPVAKINGKDTDLLEKWLQPMFDSYEPTALLGACWEMQKDHPQLVNDLYGLQKIGVPTRVIHGCCDPFVPYRLSVYTQNNLGASAYNSQDTDTEKPTKINFGGHGAFFEQPDYFSGLLDWNPRP